MTAVTVGKSKLKIMLDAYESSNLFNRTDELTCCDPQTRSVLRTILGCAIAKTDFKLDCKKLYVEMYPTARGGYVIYFIKLPYRKRYKKTKHASFMYLLRFSDTNSAISAAKIICTENIVKSSLYKMNPYYFLIISSKPSGFSSATITEFADQCLCSDMACAIVSEYGDSVINENAIEKLSSL